MLANTFRLGLALWIAQYVAAEPIPEGSGPYNVGMRRYVVPFINPGDPTSPNNVSTEYLATIYYPTEDEPSSPAPYLEPELAQMFANVFEFNVSHLTTTMRWNASFLPEAAGPSLIFGPGAYGPSTDGFRILMSQLASQGYAIGAIDHPYEQPFLRFPNGTGLVGLPLNYASTIPWLEVFHEVRVREALHFVDYWPQLVADMYAPFRTDNLGVFGHSFGGSAALDVGIKHDNVGASLNQDGTIFGLAADNLPASDAGKPTMILASENHTAAGDASFGNYTSRQSDWWRVITVAGARHQDLSDQSYWKQWGTNRTLGTIDGARMADIRSTYVSAFFEEHLLGQESPLLDGPSEDFPEVTVGEGNDI